ncbi:MAG: hypothetical protein QF410_04030 [Planctomycetota bacterium]|nr:hypothetical protein [Planctomycetota bacterium]
MSEERSAGAGEPRVPFVSRGDAHDAPRPAGVGADGEPIPRAADPEVAAVLALAVALLLFSWSRLSGYQLADSVEYMDRAHSLVEGIVQDPAGSSRSFAFSALLTPFFAVADFLQLADRGPVVIAVRLMQILLATVLVLAIMRITARLHGRSAALAAGLVVAANPIFLQYAVSPIAGIAAAVCTAMGIDSLLRREGERRALVGGLWLGGALLMAYQTFVIALPLLALVALRDRKRAPRCIAAAGAGVAVALAAQVALDRFTWGSWGMSLEFYLVQNVGGVAVRVLHELGLDSLARPIYERMGEVFTQTAAQSAAEEEVRQLQAPTWYFTNLHLMLSWPALVLTAAGLWRSWRKPGFGAAILIALLVLNVGVMSMKGSKSFRLWLPLLPMIAPLCGIGWAALRGAAPGVFRPRVLGSWALLAAVVVLGVWRLGQLNSRRFGTYWEAMQFVVDHAVPMPDEGGDVTRRPVVTSAYHWAVAFREGGDVELFKLPHHLDQWKHLEQERRAEVVDHLGSMDWLLLHGGILEQERSLFEAIRTRFGVADYFWNPEADAELGPVYVLATPDAYPDARELVEVDSSGPDPTGYRRSLQLDRALPMPLDFVGRSSPGGPFDRRLTLLGWRYETLPASGNGWITYHWTTPTGLDNDYTVVDRVTAAEGKHAWQNNHGGGWGFFPTHEWEPGWVVRESYPILAGEEPFSEDFVPLGGPYRRGDRIPVTLWMTVAVYGEGQTFAVRLRPAEWEAPEAIDWEDAQLMPGNCVLSAEGFLQSPDDLVRVGPFTIPVHDRFRWPDDGGADPP